jgi:hypothetical protein
MENVSMAEEFFCSISKCLKFLRYKSFAGMRGLSLSLRHMPVKKEVLSGSHWEWFEWRFVAVSNQPCALEK